MSVATIPVSNLQVVPCTIEEVLAYEHSALVARLQEKLAWNEPEALEAFEDAKRFLFLCSAIGGGPFAPTARIDEVWHNFILFTEDYANFCRQFFGRFIHHRPHRKDDPPPRHNLVRHTLKTAQEVFGPLSSNWNYTRDGSIVLASDTEITCDAVCNGHCAGSTNCQE